MQHFIVEFECMGKKGPEINEAFFTIFPPDEKNSESVIGPLKFKKPLPGITFGQLADLQDSILKHIDKIEKPGTTTHAVKEESGLTVGDMNPQGVAKTAFQVLNDKGLDGLISFGRKIGGSKFKKFFDAAEDAAKDL